MANYEKTHVLIGAGKLGRGYLADLFKDAGYNLIFMEYSREMVAALREQGYYTLFRSREDGTGTDVIKFDDFEIYNTQDDYDKCVEILSTVNSASMHTYDDGFRPIGHMLGDAVIKRVAEGNEEFLNVLVVANYLNPDKIVKGYMFERLTTEEQKNYVEEKVGLVQTLAYRGGYPASEEQLAQDPLAVAATDYPELPADEEAFKFIPEGVNFLLLDRMSERLNIKLWTANIRGGIVAAVGKSLGYVTVEEANGDPYVVKCAMLGWREAYYAAMKHFNFTEEEFKKGARKDSKVYNKTTTDMLDRQVFGLKRKLGRQERFVGPALASLGQNRVPYFIAKAISLVFKYDNPEDPDSVEVLQFVGDQGIEKAVEKYCQLDLENEQDYELYRLVLASWYDQNDVDPSTLDY